MANYKYYKRYCSDIENVENFEKAKADNFVGWCIHHRLQTWTSDGKRREVDISAAELQALGMYCNRPASELIFLTESEHQILHTKGKQGYWKGKTGPNKDKQLSKETRKRMSDAHKGKTFSQEHRKRLGEAAKARNTGKHWYNNGIENKLCFECPTGFVPGRLS